MCFSPMQLVDPTIDDSRLIAGLRPALQRAYTAVRTALARAPHQKEDFMRKLTIIPCVIAACVAGACGDKHSKSSDANAAEVTTVSPETSNVSTPTSPGSAGTVSFDGAQTAYTEKRYDEAVRLFTSYTSEHPENVWGFYMLGLSAWKTGDRDAAVRAFTQALEKDSTHVKSRLNLSRVLIEQGKAEEALGPLARAIEIDSTVPAFHTNLGRALERTADRSRLAEAFVEEVKTWR